MENQAVPMMKKRYDKCQIKFKNWRWKCAGNRLKRTNKAKRN